MEPKKLTNRTALKVRFSDVDSMKIVWHGNYVHYFEDGREAFGNEYGLKYMDVYREGFVIPIVQIHVEYKHPLMYGESATIETTYVDSEAARIVYNYRIFREGDNQLLVTGSSVQAFLTMERQLMLTVPPFFLEWKKRNNLIS